MYQTGALSPAHLADITAKQREVGLIVRRVIADGMKSGDFDVQDLASATLAVLSLCLDVARWYRPGYRITRSSLATRTRPPPSASSADTRRLDLPGPCPCQPAP